MNETIINLFGQFYFLPRAADVHLFHTFLYTKFLAGHLDDLNRVFDGVSSMSVWIIPIHEQSHWQILVIVNATCPPRPTAMLLDSMAARGQSRNAKSIAAFANTVVVRVVCAEPASTLVAIATVALVPQQPNGYDCGVYTLLNIMHLVHDYDSIVAVKGPGQVDWRASQHRRDLLQQLHELKDLYQQYIKNRHQVQS